MAYFDGNDTEQDTELDEDDLHERYDDALDEVYGDVSVAGMDYSTSRALKELDPIAYRVGFSDWLDGEIQDGAIIDTDEG